MIKMNSSVHITHTVTQSESVSHTHTHTHTHTTHTHTHTTHTHTHGIDMLIACLSLKVGSQYDTGTSVVSRASE